MLDYRLRRNRWGKRINPIKYFPAILFVCSLMSYDVFAGWRWTNADPQGFDLNRVCAGLNGEFVAVGNAGTILRWDGAFWHEMRSGTQQNLYGVSRFGSDGYVAVGSGGTIIRWDGSRWSAMAGPTDADLKAVWASDAGIGFAVGVSGSAIVWDGATWSGMETHVSEDLASIWGSSETDVWAVGGTGTVIRWNGASWVSHTTGTVVPFTGVGGTGPSNVYVYGSMFFSAAIYHYDGTAWSEVEHGVTFGYGDYFSSGDMWVSVSGEVYAVGSTHNPGDHSPLSQGQLIEWNGSEWSGSVQGYCDLNSVSGSAAGRLVVAGEYGRLKRKAGDGWHVDNRFTGLAAHDVQALSPLEIYLLDSFDYPFYRDEIYHWNGSVWDSFYINMTGGECRELWVADANEMYVVGTYGAAARFDGTVWTPVDTGTTHHLRNVWGPGPDDVYAVGESGTIVHWKDGSCSVMVSGTSENLNAIWGSHAGHIVAAGETGTVLVGDGISWQPVDTGLTSNFNAVHGLHAGLIYVAGDGGSLVRWDGNSWMPVPFPDTADLHAVRVNSPEELFLGGDSGVFLWDGISWRSILGMPVDSISGCPGFPEIVVSTGRGVLRRTGEPADQSVRIRIAEPEVHPGDVFRVQAYLYNDGPEALAGVPTYIILDVFGQLFFWPSWCRYAPPDAQNVDCDFIDVPVGITSVSVIPPFVWPDTGPDFADGLYFYGAMLDPGQTAILGELDSVRWGYTAANP